MRIKRLVAKELSGAERPAHGGDVWDYPHIIDFSSNVNPLGPSQKVLEAIEGAIAEITRYPPSGEELRRALAERHEVKPECVVLGNGSSELIKAFCEVFLGRGDVALIPQPTFSEYEYFSALQGAGVREVLLPPVGNDSPMNSLRGVKAAFVCNPNNPTGGCTPPEEIEALAEEAERAGSVLLVDEAYAEFSGIESASTLVGSFGNLVVLRSMTKFYSIPGLRIGYAIASEEVAGYLSRVLPPWNVNTLAMRAALAALEDEEFAERSREYIAEEKARLFSELHRLPGMRVYPSGANFFLINIKNTGMSSREMKARLAERGFLIRDCSSFRHLGEEHIRICIRRREENLGLLSAVEELLDGQT